MAARKTTRKHTPRRTYSLRADTTVGKGRATIEKAFGLPKGSVRLVLPSGDQARSDKAIGKLLKDWGD